MDNDEGKKHEHQARGVIMFDGHDETKYPQWKLWAKLKLHRLRRSGVPEDALGAELMTWLVPGSPAFEVCEELNEDVLMGDLGVPTIWSSLDARFPVKRATDKQNEAMEKLFVIRPH